MNKYIITKFTAMLWFCHQILGKIQLKNASHIINIYDRTLEQNSVICCVVTHATNSYLTINDINLDVLTRNT